MMRQELLKHKQAYTILFLALFLFTVFFMGVWPDQMRERLAIAVISLFYFFWGVITHVKSAHISRRIVFEYLGVSLLAGAVLLLITF